ncbi:MAG TPA: cysteine synthase A [Polyangiaceae bacterium]|nr:cysteine synthase A [Polyangiaceae bacterium]
MIHRDVSATVGRTPLVALGRLSAGLPGRVAIKLESRNPGGSVKDRIGVAMIEDAEMRGILRPGATLVESTSGNTGIALAFIAAARGYKLKLTMPERMSSERVSLLRYLGADVVLTPGSLMKEAVARANELEKEITGAVQLRQFENPANPEAHRRTTAVEIWEDTRGEVDAFVAGVGTGGTITGVGEVLKRQKAGVRIVAVEPEAAAVLSGGKPRHHMIQGIGAGFVPPILNRNILDEIMPISEDAAFAHARRLAREEGILAGISSGANVAAALALASRPEMKDKLIVTIICDTGERYVNTPLVSELAAKK